MPRRRRAAAAAAIRLLGAALALPCAAPLSAVCELALRQATTRGCTSPERCAASEDCAAISVDGRPVPPPPPPSVGGTAPCLMAGLSCSMNFDEPTCSALEGCLWAVHVEGGATNCRGSTQAECLGLPGCSWTANATGGTASRSGRADCAVPPPPPPPPPGAPPPNSTLCDLRQGCVFVPARGNVSAHCRVAAPPPPPGSIPTSPWHDVCAVCQPGCQALVDEAYAVCAEETDFQCREDGCTAEADSSNPQKTFRDTVIAMKCDGAQRPGPVWVALLAWLGLLRLVGTARS